MLPVYNTLFICNTPNIQMKWRSSFKNLFGLPSTSKKTVRPRRLPHRLLQNDYYNNVLFQFKDIKISFTHNLFIQWNPSIAAALGERHFGRYIGAAVIEGSFCIQTVHLGPGFLAVISQLAVTQGWPLRGVPL